MSIERMAPATGVLLLACFAAQASDADQFFEKNVRPVLVKNCHGCHNPKLKTGSLDLTVPPQADISKRLLKAVEYEGAVKMPPPGKLSNEEIASIRTWVEMGAPWPGATPSLPQPGNRITQEQRQFWAFQPIAKVTPPKVRERAWALTPVDQFIGAGLEAKGLQHSGIADKLTLLRRATFDLTGLPPTEAEIRDFLADRSPAAFSKVVDRLLASPRYGERWGRHWLDVARYADSTGNDEDHRYPYAWRYRDYVIDAFNADMPYDNFVREQIAGDLLPGAEPVEPNRRGIIATGFLALGPKALAQQDRQKMMYDIYDEQVDVVSKAVLGLTIACARCHDHKFDPILTADYYSLVSIFASTKQFGDGKIHDSTLLFRPLVPSEQYDLYSAEQHQIHDVQLRMDEIVDGEVQKHFRDIIPRLADYMVAARQVYEDGARPEDLAAASQLEPAMLARWVGYLKPAGQRFYLDEWQKTSPAERADTARAYQVRFNKQLADWRQTLEKWHVQAKQREDDGKPLSNRPRFSDETDHFFYDVYIAKGPFTLPDNEREHTLSDEALGQFSALRAKRDSLEKAAMPEPDLACAVAEGKPVQQKVLLRGDYNTPGEDAPKRFPLVLARPDDPGVYTGSGRLELSNWIANPSNPLTARVMVNRIWTWHFGEGIVRTPDNFGKMGDRPSNSQLLDYLAQHFIDSGWSVKAMHRLIMLSRTYQLSSITPAQSAEADPDNRLFSHFNRRRLDIEEIRDGLLAADGSLDLAMGGTLMHGFGNDSENSAERLSLNPATVKRRTVYLPLRRANLPTLLNLFDFGDATTASGKRSPTNIAPQALFMMNSEFIQERSRQLAKQLLAADRERPRIEQAYLRILNREPTQAEVTSGLSYVHRFLEKFPQRQPLDGWQSLCRILISSNEFVYLN